MHEPFLLAALDQAQLGRGFCAPNPSVGAVAVQNGQIIAQAWHKGAGTPHAEQLLLAQLPPKMPGLSLYITLEPCNHWGRTPPCVDSIIDYGIEQVVFAFLDPNPLVAQNNSSAKLRQAGIKVEHVPLNPVDNFYKSYQHWLKTGLPFVTAKMAQSFDGRIAKRDKERLILSNALCQEWTHKMRASSDVLLTTARTVNLDNPQMNARIQNQKQAKPLAIIDSSLSVNNQALIFTTAKHCFIYHKNGQAAANYPNSSYYAMPLKADRIDLKAVLIHLGSLGYHDVWVEAGAELFTSLHVEGLVDRTYLYLVPKCLGENAISAYQKESMFDKPHTVSWQALGDNMVACLDWQEK